MKQKILFFLFIIFISNDFFAQDVLKIVSIEQANEQTESYTYIFSDTTNLLDINQVSSIQSRNLFLPLKQFHQKPSPKNTYWLYISTENDLQSDIPLGLAISKHNHLVDLFTFSGTSVQVQKTGFYRHVTENDEIIPFTHILNLRLSQKTDIYLKIKNINDELPDFSIKLTDLKKTIKQNNRVTIFDGLVQGMLWVMIFYGIILFFFNRDRLYLYYSLYIISISLWYFLSLGLGYRLFADLPREIFPYLDIPAFLGYIFYLQFIRMFIDTPLLMPKWDKLIKLLQIVISVEIVRITVFVSFTRLIDTNYFIQSLVAALTLLIILLFIVKLFFNKSALIRIIAIGSSLLLLGTLISLIHVLFFPQESHLVVQKAGTLSQLLVFTFGISFRYNLIEKDKEKYHKRLIAQLSENAKLHEEMTRELEQKVKARTIEIAQKNVKLEEQKTDLETALGNLKRAQSQLVQSEKMASLGQLVAGIAHEINNPVNFISAGVDSLNTNIEEIRQVLDIYHKITPANAGEKLKEIEALKEKVEYKEAVGEINRLIKSIKNGTNRTTEIVKGLRTFSRLDEDILKMADIHEGLDSTLILLQNKYKNRIDIVKNYTEIPLIECFPGPLNQVFMNILSNAIDAIDDKGTIIIHTSISGDLVKVSIKDTGHGIPENIRGMIFDPFFTTKDVGKGTGLGLSISQSIIEKHEGTINVISEIEKGTEFVISLPLRHSKE
jgi:signal transduction histidine kinase